MKNPVQILLNDPKGPPTGNYRGIRIRIGRLWIEFLWKKRKEPTGGMSK